MISFLRRRTDTERALDLQRMSDTVCRRVSTSRFDRLRIGHEGQFVIEREGSAKDKRTFESYRQAQDYIRHFYVGLRDGSGAPDDIFMDSLGAVTKRS